MSFEKKQSENKESILIGDSNSNLQIYNEPVKQEQNNYFYGVDTNNIQGIYSRKDLSEVGKYSRQLKSDDDFARKQIQKWYETREIESAEVIAALYSVVNDRIDENLSSKNIQSKFDDQEYESEHMILKEVDDAFKLGKLAELENIAKMGLTTLNEEQKRHFEPFLYYFLGRKFESISSFVKSIKYYTKSIDLSDVKKIDFIIKVKIRLASIYEKIDFDRSALNLTIEIKDFYESDTNFHNKEPLLSIYNSLYALSYGEESMKYLEKMYSTALDTIDYDYLGFYYICRAHISIHSGDFDQAEGYINTAKKKYDKCFSTKYKLGEFDLEGVYESYYLAKKDYNLAKKYCQKRIDFIKKNHPENKKGLGNAYIQMGYIEYCCKDFENAESWCKKALKLFQRFHFDLGVSSSVQCIGYLNYLMGNTEDCQKYSKIAFNISKMYESESPSNLIQMYRNYIEFSIKDGDYEEARHYLKNALDVIKSNHIDLADGIIYYAKILLIKDNDLALEEILNTLEINYNTFELKAGNYESNLPFKTF